MNRKAMIPRLNIVFASDRPIAAIVRRGPSRWSHLLRWDTSLDEIQFGSWFHGRIYEDGCSLSPNGKLFAYLATKYHGIKTRGVDEAWIAISKLPYLTALALWPQSDTYSGRACFVDNNTLMIDWVHWDRQEANHALPLPTEFSVIPRWIGRGAPSQILPAIATTSAYFDGELGVDQAGKDFQYENGFLLRDGNTIMDFNDMEPQPKPSPDHACKW